MTVNMRHITPLFLLAALLLAGCAHDEVSSEQGNHAIRLNVDLSRMMEGTRALTIDNNTALQGQDLRIDAYYHDTETAYLSNTKLHYESSWKFWDGSAELHYYWPIEGSVETASSITISSLDFVGYCPFTTPSYITSEDYDASDGVTFTCDLSSYMTLASQASMQEYLVAVLDAQTYATQTAAGGALPLNFKHPFALVKFTITAASGTNVQINSISLDELYTGGTCAYDGSTMTWSSLSGSATMTLAQTLKNGGTPDGTPFVVIPNDYGSKTLTVNATWDDWSNPLTMDVSANVTFNWTAGHIYTYNLTLEKYALKVETTSTYTEQW